MDGFSHVGADADAVAALALVRALIRALKASGSLPANDVDALLDDAAAQMTQGGPGRKFVGGQGIIEAMRPTR
jgi:hypothetical protein